MDKQCDTLCKEKFNGNDNEYISLWSFQNIAVVEGNGIHGVVQRTEDKPPKEDENSHVLLAETFWDGQGSFSLPGWQTSESSPER